MIDHFGPLIQTLKPAYGSQSIATTGDRSEGRKLEHKTEFDDPDSKQTNSKHR